MDTKSEQDILHIPEELMQEAVKMFAYGSSRPTVTEYILSIDPRPPGMECLNDLSESEAKVKVSQKIRSADPRSSRFSNTLYGELYILHREAARAEAVERVTKFTSHFHEKIISNHFVFHKLAEGLKGLIHLAKNREPQNNSEYLKTIKTLISVIEAENKNIKFIQDEVLDHLLLPLLLTQSEIDVYNSSGEIDSFNPYQSPKHQGK